MDPVTLICGVVILIGLAGVVVPVIPGLLLVLAGIAVWATERQDAAGWAALAVAVVVIAAGSVVKYLLPGRRLRDDGVPWRTLAAGALLGVVGFFVVPFVGLPLGFVLGIYLVERQRLAGHDAAWVSTKRALVAVGISILIELTAGLLAAGAWLAAVLVTA